MFGPESFKGVDTAVKPRLTVTLVTSPSRGGARRRSDLTASTTELLANGVTRGAAVGVGGSSRLRGSPLLLRGGKTLRAYGCGVP